MTKEIYEPTERNRVSFVVSLKDVEWAPDGRPVSELDLQTTLIIVTSESGESECLFESRFRARIFSFLRFRVYDSHEPIVTQGILSYRTRSIFKWCALGSISLIPSAEVLGRLKVLLNSSHRVEDLPDLSHDTFARLNSGIHVILDQFFIFEDGWYAEVARVIWFWLLFGGLSRLCHLHGYKTSSLQVCIHSADNRRSDARLPFEGERTIVFNTFIERLADLFA